MTPHSLHSLLQAKQTDFGGRESQKSRNGGRRVGDMEGRQEARDGNGDGMGMYVVCMCVIKVKGERRFWILGASAR